MSEPERDRNGDAGDRVNDAYGWIDRMAPELLRASRELVENNEVDGLFVHRVQRLPAVGDADHIVAVGAQHSRDRFPATGVVVHN